MAEPVEFDHLSSVELRQRLIQRGCSEEEAAHLVSLRDYDRCARAEIRAWLRL